MTKEEAVQVATKAKAVLQQLSRKEKGEKLSELEEAALLKDAGHTLMRMNDLIQLVRNTPDA